MNNTIDTKLEQAVALYLTGKSLAFVEKDLHIKRLRLTNHLKQNNLLRSREESCRNAKLNYGTINDNCLDILTPEALYWIGFLYADGHIEADRARIVIGLSVVDIGHLEKFKNFFGDGLNINSFRSKPEKDGFDRADTCRIQFTSPRIHKRLMEFGFHNRKTYNIVPHELLRNSRDFWRGVVDGDGWVTSSKGRIILGLSGGEDTIEGFLDFLHRSGAPMVTKARKSTKSEVLYTCDIVDDRACLGLTVLYKDSITYLDRKYQKYLEISSL